MNLLKTLTGFIPWFYLQSLKEAFKIFDKNKNGYIEAKELKSVTTTLGSMLTDEEFDEFWREADINNDGKLDYEEFIKIMSQYWKEINVFAQSWKTICDIKIITDYILDLFNSFGSQKTRRMRSVGLSRELLIPVLCGVFLIENLSVIIQVGYFKYTKKKFGEGRRVFRMAPIHHHYQKVGLHEAKIVARFWIIAVLLAVVAIVTLKVR